MPASALAQTQAVAAGVRDYAIPAGSLKDALDVLASQDRVSVLFPPELVAGKTTRGVSGRLAPAEALRRLLEGSGLESEYVNDTTVVIRQGSPHPSAAKPQAMSRSAPATTQSVEPEVQDLDKIVVTATGSRLTTMEAPLPVASYDSQRISQSGQPTLTNFLATLPEVSVAAPLNPRANYGGTATVQLRGMPPGTTLLLLDGYRLGNSAVAASNFDLNQIPSALIDRVEVMPFGSSAIYGSDAIAGVVNIDLKTFIEQPNAEVTYGYADRMETFLASGAYGYSNGKLSAFIGASYMNRDGLDPADRAATRNPDFSEYANVGGLDKRSLNCQPGTVRAASGMLNGVGAPSAAIPDRENPSIADFAAGAGRENRCNPSLRLVNALEQAAVIGGLAYDVSDRHTIKLSAFLSRTENDALEDNMPLADTFVPATNLYNPFGQDVIVTTSAPAPNLYSSQSTYFRPSIAVSGDLGRWGYNLAVIYSNDRARIRDYWTWDEVALAAALSSSNPETALNPFRPSSSPTSVLNSLSPLRINRYLAESYFAHARLDGTVLELPAGPVEVVVGTEFESGTFDRDMTSGNLVGFGGDREILSLFGEVAVPLLRDSPIGQLSLSGAVRYSDYSDFGTATTPQISLQWRPMESLLLRAAYSEAFKAPNHWQLLAPQETLRDVPHADPKLGGIIYPMTLFGGGNLDLSPETGRAIGASADWHVPFVPGLTVTGTYFETRQDNRIVNPVPFRNAFLASEESFPGRVIRGVDGRVELIDATFINYAELEVRGLDLSARYRARFDSGVLTSSLGLSNFLTYRGSTSPLLPVVDLLGSAVTTDAWAPRLRGTASAAWAAPGFNLFTSVRYVSSYQDYPGAGGLSRRIGGFMILDASVEVHPAQLTGNPLPLVGDGLYFRLAATNLLDRRPAYSNYGGASGPGYDPLQEDIIGRTVLVTVGMRF